MITIHIDPQAIMDAYHLSDEEINGMTDYVVKEIAARFAGRWEIEALNELSSSRQLYVRNIVVDDSGFGQATVRLAGILPNMIESGATGFDIKEGLLNGPNAKTGKNGTKYNTVPFSFGAPTSLPGITNGGILPESVADAIKSKPQNIMVAGGGRRSEGLKEDEIPKQFQEPQKKSFENPKSKSFEQYTHKSSIYEGASRVKDPVTNQNHYQSFRRVSDNSDDNSWQHPGLIAKNLAEQALKKFDIENEAGRAVDNYLSSLGFE